MSRGSIAELIEKYLLDRLTKNKERFLELRRLDIANELGCAPSQVTYVLSTRFSESNGFYVESRRGNGGFIRIQQMGWIDESEEEFVDMEEQLIVATEEMELSFEEFNRLPYSLMQVGLISRKENELLQRMMQIIEEWVPVAEQPKVAKDLIELAVHFK